MVIKMKKKDVQCSTVLYNRDQMIVDFNIFLGLTTK